MMSHVGSRALAQLGYEYVSNDSGNKCDLVLRQLTDSSAGFVWRGQDDYNAVGYAVLAAIREQMVTVMGLEALSTGGGAMAYATPGLAAHTGPVMLCVCGAAPGGYAGVWGRALCINDSTLSGGMHDYIANAVKRGWACVVADPHSDIRGPHAHLRSLWAQAIAPSPASKVLIVAHSYGAAFTFGLLKSEEGARRRVAAIALTDGQVRTIDGWVGGNALLYDSVPTAEQVDSAVEEAQRKATAGEEAALEAPAAKRPKIDVEAKRSELEGMRAELGSWAQHAPLAFAPPSVDVVMLVARIARNWVASSSPLGTPLAAAGDRAACDEVSAGHSSHPATTHAATSEVFAFLERAADGEALASKAVDAAADATALAMRAMANACCKHSKYRVGACLVGLSGRMHTGVNVESDSYGLCCCAERCALFKGLSEGERHFAMLVCATKDGGISCGACRQLLREYCPPAMPARFVDEAGRVVRDTTVGAMLPDPFVLEATA